MPFKSDLWPMQVREAGVLSSCVESGYDKVARMDMTSLNFYPSPNLRGRGLLRVRDRPHQVGVGGAAGEDLPAVLQVSLVEFPLEDGRIRLCLTLSTE